MNKEEIVAINVKAAEAIYKLVTFDEMPSKDDVLSICDGLLHYSFMLDKVEKRAETAEIPLLL